MSCITKLLEIKGDKDILPIHDEAVIEGGGSYKGFEYLITFTSHGNRCGYIAIPDGFGVDYSDINCHGGITFEDREHNAKNLLPIPCDDLWIGFDCAHWGDKRCSETAKKYFPRNNVYQIFEENFDPMNMLDMLNSRCSHKTYDFVEKECHHIIEQLIDSQEAA